ncbi:MAG: formate dehydrogenase subunit delta [Paracoccus sp. (in: a-proteobacteria)]|nr:formate dehydrogenase subunit delta [Paracoccus sp. (in: a-proteobacteria)]
MITSAPPKIARMANQIARFMESRPPEGRATGLAAHINDYWEPRMRRQLLALIDAGGEGLVPMVIEAAPMIRPPPPEVQAINP